MSTTARPRRELLRILGASFGITVTVGGTIGVGILRTPGLVAAQIPNGFLILLLWLLGGLYALVGTLSVVELATALPKAGGWYVYARRAFGEFGGFVVGWSDWVAQSAALAYLSTAIGEFAVALFPGLSSVRAVAVATLAFFAALHALGLRSSSWTQDLTSLVKGVALIGFVVVCFLYGRPEGASAGAVSLPVGLVGLAVATVVALQSVIITYDGWYSAIYFTEEVANPAKNLPRSAIGGVLCIIAIYLLVNGSLLYALPMGKLSGATLPAADAAQRIFGGHGGRIITALSLVSLLSVVNAVLLLATRILFAMSRDGLFWSKASRVSRAGTPLTSMLMSAACAIALVASGTFETLIAVASFFFVAIYVSGFLAVFVLRRREPDLPRPFRVWGYPWVPLIALVGSLAFLVASLVGDTTHSLYAIGLMALSYPAYRAIVSGTRSAQATDSG